MQDGLKWLLTFNIMARLLIFSSLNVNNKPCCSTEFNFVFLCHIFYIRILNLSNIVSELSQIPDFQSRWLRGGKNIGFISYYMLLAERMTYSCTTIRLRLYDYIGYGCTTLELWLYNYKGLSCTTAEFWFFDGIHELR